MLSRWAGGFKILSWIVRAGTGGKPTLEESDLSVFPPSDIMLQLFVGTWGIWQIYWYILLKKELRYCRPVPKWQRHGIFTVTKNLNVVTNWCADAFKSPLSLPAINRTCDLRSATCYDVWKKMKSKHELYRLVKTELWFYTSSCWERSKEKHQTIWNWQKCYRNIENLSSKHRQAERHFRMNGILRVEAGRLQWTQTHQLWTVEEWKELILSPESIILI